jgi:integrase
MGFRSPQWYSTMAGKSKGPWYWKDRKEYVVNVHGRRYYLGPDKNEAERQWHDLMATPKAQHRRSNDGIFAMFLKWCKDKRPDSHEWYRSRIDEFLATVPGMTVDELQPHHVDAWADTKNSSGHQRGCIIAVKRALNWAVKKGHIKESPLKGMEMPKAGRRTAIVTPDQFNELLTHASDQRFKDLLVFLWETGARPQEALRLEARHVDGKRCIFPKEESKGKERERVIFLTPTAQVIVDRLVNENPDGRLFRNAKGDPWHRNNVACRFARMKKRIGRKLCLYNLRHSYCTRALKNGVDPITLAELMGHSSAEMIMRVYQHVSKDVDHMVAAAEKATT